MTPSPLVKELKGLLPAPLVVETLETFKDMLRAAGAAPEAEDPDVDALVDALRARDRPRLGQVYDAMRETDVFHRIVTAEPLREAAQAMTGARRLHSPFQHAVFRMDLAGEPWRGFDWHQDYPYNMLCSRSVTAWTPLTPSGAANGGVDLVETTEPRLYPVDVRVKRDAQGRALGTTDAFITEPLHAGFKAASRKPELQPGDVLMFHNTVPHRSGYNPGPRHRYSIQVRFGDLLAPEVIARGWRNRRADGFEAFAALHPDLIASKEYP